MSEHENIPDRSFAEKHFFLGGATETIVYGRHFMTKPPAIFLSQEKKMIINVLWSGISIQTIPSSASSLEVIKYRDILNVLIPSENKEKELSIVYNSRKVATGKNPQTTVTFRSEDRQGFLADFFRGVDKFAEAQSMKFLCGISANFMTISAYFIMDKATKSHFECNLTCYNSHLLIEFIKPAKNIAEDKFTRISKAMVINKTQEEGTHGQQAQDIDGQSMNSQQITQGNQVKSQGDSNNTNPIESSTPQVSKTPHDTPSSQHSLDHNSSSSSNASTLKHTLAIRYKDILRIQKKQNGFQINLLRPSLSLAFFNNDLNIINGFINRLAKNAKDSTYFQISVTSTLQEEIHYFPNIDSTQFEVDFAVDAKRVVPSKTHKRSCVLTMGRNGIAEVDRIHGEIYEAYDMKHLKDIVREEHSGSVRNSLKLVFFNGIEVEYVFKPFQRDVFVVELLTNINMYYETQAPCRRCLDIIHSRTPNYALEIRGWKVETGVAERDSEVDAELIRNIALAKGEEKFFSALREFNVNCHLKRTNDADVAIYRQLVTTLGKYLMVFDDPDLLFFIKHLKILKAIPRNFGMHSKIDMGRQEKERYEQRGGENQTKELINLGIEQEQQTNLNQADGSLRLEDEDFVQLMKSSNKMSKFGQRAVKGNNDQIGSQSQKKSGNQQGISGGDYSENESDDHSVDGKNFEEVFVDDEEIPLTATKNEKIQLDQAQLEQPLAFPSAIQQLCLSSSSSLKDQGGITDETAAQQKALNGTQPKLPSNNDLKTPAKKEPCQEEDILISQMQTTKSQLEKADQQSSIKGNNRNGESPSRQESSSSSSGRSKSTKPFGIPQQGHILHRPQALAQYFTRAATLDVTQGDKKRSASPIPSSIAQSVNLNEKQILQKAATVDIDSINKTPLIQSSQQPLPSEVSASSVMIKRLDRLRQTQQYSIDEDQLIHSMREKSLGLLKKLKKRWIKGINGEHTLKLDFPSVETHLIKVEELLKCLTIFQNCKRYFEDMTVKKERFKELKSILQLLSCPDPLIVYQTSQLFRKIGLYHSNTMQKAETDNKTFLLDPRLNILDRILYAIANFTLVKRPLLRHSTFMIRIFACYSIINTLFQARIESTAPLHRSQIIHYLQSPVFFAVANRIMHYQSFALTVNTINLLNALYYFSTENKQFINMILLNSTIFLQLLHLVIQDIYSSKQLKDIAFNLLFSLLNQRSQACFVVMNIFPKQIFKMQKTESLFVDQWTKQEWHNFFFKEIQTDIRNPHYFWLSVNLTYLDDMLIKEDKEFLAQQISELFKKINHAKDLEQFFPRLFIKDTTAAGTQEAPIVPSEVWNSGIRSVAATTSTQENSAIKSMMGSVITTHNPLIQSGIATSNNPQLNNSLLSAGAIQQSKSKDKDNNSKVVLSPEDICNRELQKEIFAGVFWNIDDFRVEYANVEDQQLCGRYYLKQLMSEGKKLMYEFLDGKGQIIEKEVKELWESLVLSLMSEQSQPRQALVLKTMCAVLREYAKVIKFTNLLPYIIRCLNLREFQELQYSQMQLLAVAVNCEDSQSKQYHCRMLSEGHNTIQELIYVMLSRVCVSIDATPVKYGEDSTNMKLKTVRYKSEENLAVIFSVLKVLQAVIGNHSHVIRKRKIFPLTKPQQILMDQGCMKALLNVLLIMPNSSNNNNIIGDKTNWSNSLEMELAGFRSGQYHGLVRNEFLKLLYNFLMSPGLLQIAGFCEMLVYQIDDQTARLSFAIIKALFNMLPQAQSILDDLTEGPGLQHRHLQAFPFFKFFPVPFLLILLTGDPEDEKDDDDNNGNQQFTAATGTGTGVATSVYSSTKPNPSNPTPFSSSQLPTQQQPPLDPTVEETCLNFRTHSEERYDLIWTAEMRKYLSEKLQEFLGQQNSKIDNFYTDNFHASSWKWNSYRGMTDALLKSFPTIEQSFSGMIMYPQLKNELSVCQIYLRPWSMTSEIEHGYLPVSFAEKTIKKITQYSSLPDIFKVINNNSSSAARNLLYLLKAQTKIFRLNIPLEIQYPYNALLLLLANSSNTLKSHLQDPSQFSDIDEQALEDLQLAHSPLLSQVKRNSFIGRAPQEKGTGGTGSNQNSLLLSPRQRPSDRARRQSIESSSMHGSSVSGFLDLSFSQPLVDSFQSTFNNYIKKILKIISLSLTKNENVEVFCENPTRISCILSVLNNIVLQTSLKNIGKQEIREYFEDVSVSYSEMKILNYGIRILHRINESAKFILMKLSQQQRNEMCLLLQRGQKITVTFFKTFVEKFNAPLSPWTSREKYGNSLSVPDRGGGRSSKSSSSSSGSKKLTSKEVSHCLIRSPSTADLQGSLVFSFKTQAKNAQTAAASHPTYEQLLDRLFNVDPESLTGTNTSVVVDKCFGACRELNDRLSRFVLSLSKNAYFLECLIRGGCIWRLIEIILVKGKQFNPLHNSQKQKNVAHLDEIALISAKTMFLVLYNSDSIVKETQIVGKDTLKGQKGIGESESKERQGLDDQPDVKTAQFLSETLIGQQLSGSSKQTQGGKDKDDLPKLKPQYKVESEIIEEEQSRISTEEQKVDNQQLIGLQQSSLIMIATNPKEKEFGEKKLKITKKRGRTKNPNNNDNDDDDDDEDDDAEEQDECEVSEQITSVKKILSEGEKKELENITRQLLSEIGSLGRDKLGFFVDQFMTALVKNVDEHLLSYLRDQQYDQFTRKINSNIELPDFIWNQLSRDNLDLNLKLQIIKVNQTLGRVFIDKLLEHQGVIKIEDRNGSETGISANNTSFNAKESSGNLNLSRSNSKRDDQQIPGVGTSGANQQQLDQEVVISGVLLRVFNEQDNFELTNPQSFQQEIFNQLKKYIDEIDKVLAESMLVPVYDPLAMNQPFETQAKAVKECIKAIYSLLTRYQGQYVILNPVNISTFFRLLQMELDNKMSLSAFKISIAKILNELSGSIQGAKTLMASSIYVRYIITNLLESSTMATPIVQQFLNSVQKLARIPENLAPLVSRRIAGVLLLNTLKKEFFKPALRVQVVDVLNEIFNLNPTFSSFARRILPARIYQKLFSENQTKQSTEVIEILENISFTSDLLWTNLMRLELIMTLEEDVRMFVKDSNENREQLAPQYPEMQNEIICTQIFIRIFNLTPAQTKLAQFNALVPQILQDKLLSKQQQASIAFSDLFLSNLIELTEQFSQKFIELQDESLAKRKEVLIKQESALLINQSTQQQESEITQQQNQQTVSENQQGQQLETLDPFFQEFDRVSTSYITALTSLMLCIEHIIIQEKREISSALLPQICKQFKILSENRSHSHLKSTVIQIAYLLKDQPNIHAALIESQFYTHVSQALSYSLENSAEQDYLTGIEQVIILNLLIKLIRDKLTNWRKRTIEENKLHCLPVICRLLETITEDNSFIKSYLISYCAEVLKSGFYQEEIASIIDMTTFSSKQLIASKNTNCEWVNLWRGCILNYGESNCLGEMQQQQDHQVILYDGFFTLPIQSEFSIQSLPFPPQQYLTRLQEIEEFKIVYEKGSTFKRSGQAESILLDSATN